MLVVDVGRLHRLRDQLGEVAGAEVGAEVALVIGRIALVKAGVEVTRRADSYHDDAHLALGGNGPGVLLAAAVVDEVAEAAGEQEPHVFVCRLGPAVEVVRQRQPVGIEHVHLAGVNQVVLVPVSGVVGAGDDDPRGAGLVGTAQHVVGHDNVAVLVMEMVKGGACAARVAQVHHGVHPLEQVRVLAAVRIDQVSQHDALDAFPLPVLFFHVDQHHPVRLGEGGQKLVCDVPCCAGHKHRCCHTVHYLSV